MRRKQLTGAALCSIPALGLSVPAVAGDWMVEVLSGYQGPDSIDDDGEIYGARVG